MFNYIAIVPCLINCGGYAILEKPCELCAKQQLHGHFCTQCLRHFEQMLFLMAEAEKAATHFGVEEMVVEKCVVCGGQIEIEHMRRVFNNTWVCCLKCLGLSEFIE